MQNHQWKAFLVHYFQGLAIGVADVIPGVSGGTIAFILGIYERLLEAINQIVPSAVSVFKRKGVQSLLNDLDAKFLLSIGIGIGTSIVILSKIINHWFQNQQELLFSFFFGLISVSSIFIGLKVKKWNLSRSLLLTIGLFMAYGLTELTPITLEPNYFNFFISGTLAICALILPGISGSFVLLMLGMYQPTLAAVHHFNLGKLSVFACGCAIGLLSFSRILTFFMYRFLSGTLAVLTGFMIGSLNKLWPWKASLHHSTSLNSVESPTLVNVNPLHFESLTGKPSKLAFCLLVATLGAIVIVILAKFKTPETRPPTTKKLS